MMRARGAAMIESVVVLGVVLTVMFGTFEIGLIGLTQLSSDGAAFLAAHASVMGDSPTGVIASPFPMMNNPSSPSVVTISTSAPDSISEPVDYQISNQSNRHGGAQVVRPSHTQASVTQSNVGIGLIMPLVSGGSGFIEGNETVSDDGFDLAGTNLNSSQGEASEVNYFSDDGNAPPYFIGFRYLFHCLGVTYGSVCNASNGNYQMDAVGLAEYLDGTNWNMPVNGTNSPSAVFYAMLVHQQTYANLAKAIDYAYNVSPGAAVALAPIALTNGKTASLMSAYMDPVQEAGMYKPTSTSQLTSLPAPFPCLLNVYHWDIKIPAGYQIGTTQIGSYPLNTTYKATDCQ